MIKGYDPTGRLTFF
jgi:hypothetical protein